MASFTFTPTIDVPDAILGARSTHAKICIKPLDAYVDAVVRPVAHSSRWTASIASVPRSTNTQLVNQQAVLHLFKGELGNYIGAIDLGHI